MEETRYIVEEEYPGGHDIGYNSYGPATKEQFFNDQVPRESQWSASWSDCLNFIRETEPDTALEELFSGSELRCSDGVTFTVKPVRDYVVIVTWQEPQDGVTAYGPYTPAEAQAAIPKIEPHFVNPFMSAEERDDHLAHVADIGTGVFSAEQCADMGYKWGGVIPEDVTFDIDQLRRV